MMSLTRNDGTAVYVNPDAIKYVVPDKEGATIVWREPGDFPLLKVQNNALQVATQWQHELRFAHGAEG